jgi:hypothetical protein
MNGRYNQPVVTWSSSIRCWISGRVLFILESFSYYVIVFQVFIRWGIVTEW